MSDDCWLVKASGPDVALTADLDLELLLCSFQSVHPCLCRSRQRGLHWGRRKQIVRNGNPSRLDIIIRVDVMDTPVCSYSEHEHVLRQ